MTEKKIRDILLPKRKIPYHIEDFFEESSYLFSIKTEGKPICLFLCPANVEYDNYRIKWIQILNYFYFSTVDLTSYYSSSLFTTYAIHFLKQSHCIFLMNFDESVDQHTCDIRLYTSGEIHYPPIPVFSLFPISNKIENNPYQWNIFTEEDKLYWNLFVKEKSLGV